MTTSKSVAEKYDVDTNRKEIDKYNDSGPYYGQWQTDRIIEEYFPIGDIGTCIEVGAADGIKGSNTKYFEDRGWAALCIEPNLQFKESLLRHRKYPILHAVGNTEEIELKDMTIYKVGDRNIMSSLSSLKPDKRLVKDHKHIINGKFKAPVMVMSLAKLVESFFEKTTTPNPFRNKKFDFISIDTEGTELDVLKGWDFDKYDVHLFVVENNYDDKNIVAYMKTKGYIRDRRYKINDFYIKTHTKP